VCAWDRGIKHSRSTSRVFRRKGTEVEEQSIQMSQLSSQLRKSNGAQLFDSDLADSDF
jgi:hypothetical protein